MLVDSLRQKLQIRRRIEELRTLLLSVEEKQQQFFVEALTKI